MFMVKLFIGLCMLLDHCILGSAEKNDENLEIEINQEIQEVENNDAIVEQLGKTKASHILMFHPWNTKSHRIQQNALLEGFLARGHRVTGVFPQSSSIKHDRYTEIVVEDGFAKLMNIMTKSMMEKDSTSYLQMLSLWPEMLAMMKDMMEQQTRETNTVIDIIESRNETIDAVFFTISFGYLGIDIFKKFRVPHIGISHPGWALHVSKFLGNPENPSYQPELQSPFVEPLSFWQRLSNTLIYSIQDYDILGWLWYPLFMDIIADYESYTEFLNNVSLIFLCSHFVTHSPQAWAPNAIEVGGLHCREGEKLPEDLQLFLDNHPEGVVYVSFGSTVKPSEMPAERKQIFLDTFRQLKHPVIWKWDEDDIPNLSSNVKLSKWLPQQDLLAHPNLRVFVTHGGLLSLQEALYHQTPLVGIPLGNDQKPNLLRADKKGYAIMLDWVSISSDQFLAAINKAMYDEEVKKNMKKMHDLFVDARDPPLERAMWWVEYAIRHEGTKFLKPNSVDLPWYQYHLIDVIAFIFIVLFFVLFITIKCFICFCRCCCSRKIKQE